MTIVLGNEKYKGTKIELQNGELVLPTLNFKAFKEEQALKKLNAVIKGIKKIEETEEVDLTDEELDYAIDLVFMSAKRNYPEISKDFIMEGLDFDNIMVIIPKLLTKNDAKRLQEYMAKND